MRTLIFIAAGLALLGLVAGLAPAGKRPLAVLAFIAVWLVVSGINLTIGLSRGYSLSEELMVHLFLFGIPALAAVAVWYRSLAALRG
jgi:hypothetical protein